MPNSLKELQPLLDLTAAAAREQFRKGFVANLMTTGTDQHAAIEAGILIGDELRSKVLSSFEI